MSDLDPDRNVLNVLADNQGLGSPGTTLATYTATRGPARVLGFSVFFNTAGGTVQLQLVRSGVVYVVRQLTTSDAAALGVVLAKGDEVRLQVTASGVGQVDGTLGIEERSRNS